MNYFKILGIVFGTVAFLKPVCLHLIPWDENRFLGNTYREKRPLWIIPVALSGLALVAFTWYMELNTNIRYSFVITLMFSLTAIKAVTFIFNYSRFQKWVAGMLSRDGGRKIVITDLFVSLFGLALIVLSLVLI